MNQVIRQAILKNHFKRVATLLQLGAELGLPLRSQPALAESGRLTNAQMGELIKETLYATELPQTAAALLRRAAEVDCVELVEVLLSIGLKPNERDQFDDPIWYTAIQSGSTRVLGYLLDHGLDKEDAMSVEGGDPFTLMHASARAGSVAMVRLLLKKGADPNALSSVRSPAVAKLLIKAGADVHRRGYGGRTPLHLLLGSGAVQEAEILLRMGADLNAVDENGDTPLHVASVGPEIPRPALKRLAKRYAGDLNLRNKAGQTAEDQYKKLRGRTAAAKPSQRKSRRKHRGAGPQRGGMAAPRNGDIP